MLTSLLPLIDTFAAASLDGTLWEESLKKFADATGCARTQLIGIGGANLATFNVISAADAAAHDRFDEMASYDPKINFRVAASIRALPMQLIAEADYDFEIPLLTGDGYLDFCHEADMPFGCQVTLQQSGDGLVGLSMLRTHRDGRSSEAQRAVFTAIAPHVRSAVRVQQILEQDAAKLIVGALDAMDAAVFACDAYGRVRGYSIAAEQLLQDGRLLLAPGRLKSSSKPDCDALDRALYMVMTHPAPGVASAVMMHGGTPLILDVVALPRRPWNFGFKPRALIVARGQNRNLIRSVMLLKAAYGLSEAEAHVAIGFALGKSRDQIARERGVSIHTTRVQAKSLFGKMSVNREAALATLVGQFL